MKHFSRGIIGGNRGKIYFMEESKRGNENKKGKKGNRKKR